MPFAHQSLAGGGTKASRQNLGVGGFWVLSIGA
jgi:hypothetical protein